jgi:predicted transcriptional regulator
MMHSKETAMTFNRFVAGSVAGCAVVVISAMPGLAGQVQMSQKPQTAPAAKTTPQSGMAADMTARCQAVMADREKMMAEMRAADQRLHDLVSKMNAASGMAKEDAIAAVVCATDTQRQMMQEGMTRREDGMMAHMMEHMKAGADSMTMCPVMKRMGGLQP